MIKKQDDFKEFTPTEQEAWNTVFFIENHLDHIAYPYQVATPEQVEFMVHVPEGERYYPCSDKMFGAIIKRNNPGLIRKAYEKALERVMQLIDEHISDTKQNEYLKALILIKFNHETRDQIMIPSRLEKRLIRIFLNTTQIGDPDLYKKRARNRSMDRVLHSKAFEDALNNVNYANLTQMPETIAMIKEIVEFTEFSRLLNLTSESELWLSETPPEKTKAHFVELFNKKIKGDGMLKLLHDLGITGKSKSLEAGPQKRILWMANEAGEMVMDLAIIQFLTNLGHKVIVALKEKPLYTKVRFKDARTDPVLKKRFEGAFFIDDEDLSKNDLVEILKKDNKVLVISDGTGEDTNLLLATTSFARIFKEADAVITRGRAQKRRFFDTHFKFTQNIFNISEDTDGHICVDYKERHPSVIKFTHEDLEKKARKIIDQMIKARSKGMSVMFYSGIIGSIPGKIDVAKKIMTTFIAYLEEQMSGTFIINPSHYYEPGMDADDLMYMWEIVQRSGYIDIWRFQTSEDIEETFGILGEKMPPEWVGKDATYSTGCTKEMRIAQSVLRKHPEMQVIGPAEEKFMRRDQYGIGMMYDQRLK